jgi:thymidylate synthase ThyX
MMTEWYWSGSLYAFARVCQLRLDKTAQLEVQEIARQLSAYCNTLFPYSWKALKAFSKLNDGKNPVYDDTEQGMNDVLSLLDLGKNNFKRYSKQRKQMK